LQAINILSSFLLIPFLLHQLGAQNYGLIIFAQSLMIYPMLLTDYGFSISSTIAISKRPHDNKHVQEIFWNTYYAKLSLLLISFLILIPIIRYYEIFNKNLQIYLVTSISIAGNFMLPSWYFQGIGKMGVFSTIQIIVKITSFLLLIFLIKNSDQLILAAFLLSSTDFISGFISNILIKFKYPVKYTKPTYYGIFKILKSNWHYFLSNAAASLYLNTTTFTLGIFSGATAVAIFSTAYKIVMGVQALFFPITRLILPKVTIGFEASYKNGMSIIFKYMKPILILNFIICIGTFIFAPYIMEKISGNRLIGSEITLRILSITPFSVLVAIVLSQFIMPNIGLISILSKIYILVGTLSLVILRFFVVDGQENAAAFSVLFAEVSGPVLMYLAIKYKLPSLKFIR